MDMKEAILGMLEWKSMSGYDIKKAMQESPFMHWSGNNNQIYKVLVQLSAAGFVVAEVCNQEVGPSKKVYHMTEQGRIHLRSSLVGTKPELPEYKKMFLTQLAWSNQLKTEEMTALIEDYMEQLSVQVVMKQELKRRAHEFPCRSAREVYIWNMICDNMIESYHTELRWAEQLLTGLQEGEKTNRTEGELSW